MERKIYTKPEKVKHTHESVKSTLKIYKIDEEGNVLHLRQECLTKAVIQTTWLTMKIE